MGAEPSDVEAVTPGGPNAESPGKISPFPPFGLPLDLASLGMKTRTDILLATSRIIHGCIAKAPHMEDALRGITVRVSTRMTACAGKALPSKGWIKISQAFFEDDANFEGHLENTVLHEVAHILAPPDSRSGGRHTPHGHRWKHMHRLLGGTGARTHSLELAEGYSRPEGPIYHAVNCNRCGKEMLLGPLQYKRAMADLRAGRTIRYLHKEC